MKLLPAVFSILFGLYLLLFCASCGEKEKDNNEEAQKFDLQFKNQIDELSFYVGFHAGSFSKKEKSYFSRLNKRELINGFNDVESFVVEDIQTSTGKISLLVGNNGDDFNELYVDTGSYYLGRKIKIGLLNELKTHGILEKLNTKYILEGFQYCIENEAAFPSSREKEMKDLFQEVKEEYKTEFVKKMVGEFFSNPNKKKTASGIEYLIQQKGIGPKAKSSDIIIANYTCMTPYGTKHVSSFDYKTKKPIRIESLKAEIEGLSEGLQLMNVGSKFLFYIPGELAYGNNPPPKSVVQINMPLFFEVELV